MMKDNKKVTAIIPSAGKGMRFGGDKIFSLLCGKPVLIHTLLAISSSDLINEIIVVSRDEVINEVTNLINSFGIKKVIAVIEGGAQRQDSVFNGLRHIKSDPDYVLIHDGARPLVSKSLIKDAINRLSDGEFGGVVVGLPIRDTIKKVIHTGKDTIVEETPNRDNFWSVQTPQVFNYPALLDSYYKAYKEGFYSTDDSAIFERYGGKVKIVLGQSSNIKITTKDDIFIAAQYIRVKS